MACSRCGAETQDAQRFCGACGAALNGTTELYKRPRQAGAERRQVTVMFCDLVGSTALSCRLDPEDLGEVIATYQERVSESVARLGGYVAKYLGDGVLVFFGYPQAHEDDAERAVRAGLRVAETVAKIDLPSERLRVRIGIASGLVVVGDLIGSGSSEERSILGETPNLAARLQALAEPGEVVIAQATRRLLGALYECQDLGLRDLRGFAEPVQAYRVLQASAAESRFEALHPSPVPLMGRQAELNCLLEIWRETEKGAGQTVLLSGEPGIGKSRLAAAFQDEIGLTAHRRLRYFCSPYHADSALYPVIAHIERAAGFAREDTEEERRAKVVALLAPTALAPEDIVLFGELLGIRPEVPPGGTPPDLSPQKRKEQMLAALLRQLEGLAEQSPVLLIFEDAHWADPTSLELLDLTVPRIGELPVLLIVTFRPDFKPPWSPGPTVTQLPLVPLSRTDNAALVRHVAGKKELPPELLQQLLDRTDGVPLFIEELTKSVLESGAVREEENRFVLTGPLRSLAVPASLHASLVARLDRLAAVLDVAQIGAAIGREFSYQLLAAVAALPPDVLEGALARLMEAGLISVRADVSNGTYQFKHALVQDAAYATLLRARRRQLHARIAQTIDRDYSETVERHPEVLAYHFEQAGLADRAIGHLLKAGEIALGRSALQEAMAYLSRSLELLPKVSEKAVRQRQEVDLQLLLSRAFIASKGFAAPETGRALERARKLSERLADLERLGWTLSHQWAYLLVRGEIQRAAETASSLLKTTRGRQDGQTRIVGHLGLGMSLVALGSPITARRHLERAVVLTTPPQNPCFFTLGLAAPVAARAYLGVALFELGFLERALARCREALAAAQDLREPFTTAFALSFGSLALSLGVRDHEAAALWVRDLLKISDDQGFPFYKAAGMTLRGWVLTRIGAASEGLTLARQGREALEESGMRYQVAITTELYVECCVAAGDVDAGLAAVTETLAVMRLTGERDFEPELHRSKGKLLLQLGATTEAEESFRRALDLARQQQAKLWELRAAMDLARLWRDQGRFEEAERLLGSIYGWFTEGFGTPILKQAKRLLDELGPSHSGQRKRPAN